MESYEIKAEKGMMHELPTEGQMLCCWLLECVLLCCDVLCCAVKTHIRPQYSSWSWRAWLIDDGAALYLR